MLLDAISKAGTIALGGHVRPDGDCAGSCMGLYNYVRENFPEKEIDVYLEELPNTLKFMKNTDKIRHEVTEEKTYDLFIALDCGDMGRLGFSAVLFKKAAVRFCVDHHVSNQSFADQNYIMPDASSTSELIYDLLDYGKMSVETAECLYTGMVHDTGVFRYSCTHPSTMRAAAALMEKGIDSGACIVGKLSFYGRKMYCILRYKRRDGFLPGKSETSGWNRKPAETHKRYRCCNFYV